MKGPKLSEAIRLGSMMVGEVRDAFYRDDGCACALGTAGIAVGFSEKDHDDAGYFAAGAGSECFQIPFPDYPAEILLRVSARHLDGESRLSIADWLETWEAENFEEINDGKEKATHIERERQSR